MTNYSSTYTVNVRAQKFNIALMNGGNGDPVLYIHGADGFPKWENYLDN